MRTAVSTDAQLERCIQASLVAARGPFTGVQVVAIEGRIFLRGGVPSYAVKRRAEALARAASGCPVTNQLRVLPLIPAG